MANPPKDPVIDSLLDKIERVPISQLTQFPGNPNEGNVEEIGKSLKANGLFEPVIVQRSTGHILSHNHVTQAAESIGWTHLDVIYLDCDDVRAKRIVAAANRTAELSRRNDYLLAELLGEIADDNLGLEGTGYDEAYLDDLFARVETDPALGLDDDGREMAEGPSGAHYAETDEQTAERTQQVEGIQTQAAQGLAEVVVVMPLDDKLAMLRHLEALKEHLGDQSTGHLLLRACAIATTVCDGAATNAPPVQWADLLSEAAG